MLDIDKLPAFVIVHAKFTCILLGALASQLWVSTSSKVTKKRVLFRFPDESSGCIQKRFSIQAHSPRQVDAEQWLESTAVSVFQDGWRDGAYVSSSLGDARAFPKVLAF